MGEGCGSCGPAGGGPFSVGLELVEFVYNAHGGGVRNAPIPDGGLKAKCQGCGEAFVRGKMPQVRRGSRGLAAQVRRPGQYPVRWSGI